MPEPQEQETGHAGPAGSARLVALATLGVPALVVVLLVVLTGDPEPADNSACYDCHLTFKSEPLADWHRIAGVGCVKCHGDSVGHAEDDASGAPPDRMYARDRINEACLKCHLVEKIAEDCRNGIGADGASAEVCTSCHGKHKLDERTRRWDRKTGELIRSDDSGRSPVTPEPSR